MQISKGRSCSTPLPRWLLPHPPLVLSGTQRASLGVEKNNVTMFLVIMFSRQKVYVYLIIFIKCFKPSMKSKQQ